MDSLVEATLAWSPLVLDDLDDVAELREAADYFDDPVERLGPTGIGEQWTCPGNEFARNGVVGRNRAGTVVAAGWLFPRGLDDLPRFWLEWSVHPTVRHLSLDTALVSWLRDRGCEWHDELFPITPRQPLWMGAHVDEKLALRTRAISDAGFAAERWYRDMHLTFDTLDELVVKPLPVGIELVRMRPDLSEAVRAAHNEVFAGQAPPVSARDWEHSQSVSTSRPQWSWVAMQAGEVVGYAMSSAYEQDWGPQGFSEGWTDRLGILPQWRGQGIGLGLLVASLKDFESAGLAGAGLGVDSDNQDGAVHFFESLGYSAAESVVLYGAQFA